MRGQYYWHLQRPSVDKEKSLLWLCGSGLGGRNGEFNNSNPRSSIQHALSSEEHHEAAS